MLNSVKISELLCTKLCHDLAGPIGAVNNGIDFFDFEGKHMQDKALELIKLSSKQAVNRLTFFRQAYGTVGDDTEIHFAELKGLIMKYIEDTKLSLDFKLSTDGEGLDAVSSRVGKILLNAIVIATGIIMNNGLMTVSISEINNKIKLTIEANATSFKIEEELNKILALDLDEIPITSRNIQQYYTILLVRELEGTITIEALEDKAIVSVICNKHYG